MAGRDYDLAIEMFAFALEVALKSCICKTLGLAEYPDKAAGGGKAGEVVNFFRTHEYDRLLLLSGFSREFELKPGNMRKFQNWSDATTAWDVSKRYGALNSFGQQDAERVYNALVKPNTGVITWIDSNAKW